MSEKRNKRGRRLFRRLVLLLVLALAILLADMFSPAIKKWVNARFGQINYETAAVTLSHEMEKAGELIAVRHTETGVVEGKVEALLVGTVGKVSIPYFYEIGLGVKLSQVALEAGEDGLNVTVPQAQALYDHIEATDSPQTSDFWRLPGQEKRVQRILEQQRNDCRSGYLNDSESMAQAWETVCEQLEGLFRQWTGENLRLRFIREGE